MNIRLTLFLFLFVFLILCHFLIILLIKFIMYNYFILVLCIYLYFFFHYDEKLSHCCAMPPPSSDNIDIGLLCHFFFFSRALSHPIRAQKYSLPIAEMLSAPLEKYFPAKNILYVASKF